MSTTASLPRTSARSTCTVVFVGDALGRGDATEPMRRKAGRFARDYSPLAPEDAVYVLNGRAVGPGTVVFGGDRLEIVAAPHGIEAVLIGISLSLVANFAISALLAPPPPVDPSKPAKDQAAFTGAQTTRGAGGIVPLILGECWCGGQIISSQTGGPVDDVPDAQGSQVTVSESLRDEPSTNPLHTLVLYAGHSCEEFVDFKIDGNYIESLQGVTYETSPGTRDQAPPVAFDEQTSTQAVEQSVVATTDDEGPSVTTEGPIRSAIIRLAFDQGLFEIQPNGRVTSREVRIRFDYRLAGVGAAWGTYKTVTIRRSHRGVFEWTIRFPSLLIGQYEFRVTRLTSDTADTNVADSFSWSTLTEILPGERAHPGLTWVDFAQIPTDRSGVPTQYLARIKGHNRLRVYSDASTYTLGYSANPAWCVAFLLTDPVYGLGRHYSWDDLDIEAFIAWAEHCDDPVSDFIGGTHARNVFGMEFRDTYSAETIRSLAERHDGWLVEQAGRWSVVVDKDSDPVDTITRGSYVANSIKVSDIDVRDMPRRLNGAFKDVERESEPDYLPVVDPSVLDANQDEAFQAEDSTIDCESITRPAQVYRYLIKRIRSLNLENREIQLQMGIKALERSVGDIVWLSTPTASAGKGSGRLHPGSSGRVCWLAEEVDFEAGQSYEIVVTTQSGTTYTEPLTNPGARSSIVTTQDTSPSWDILEGDEYAIGLIGESRKKYRITGKALNSDLTSAIFLRLHDATKYQIPDIDMTDDAFGIRELTGEIIPGQVTALSVVARQEGDEWRADVSWLPPARQDVVQFYEVFLRSTEAGVPAGLTNADLRLWQARFDDDWGQFRRDDGAFYRLGEIPAAIVNAARYGDFAITDDVEYQPRSVGTTRGTTFTIAGDLESSTDYEVRVVAVSPLGRRLSLERAARVRFSIET